MSKCFVKQDVLLNSISRSFMILLISLQKCIKTGKITIHLSSPDRDETFDSLKSAATGRSPNPSAKWSAQAENGSSVTPITGSPVFHPCYYGRTPFPPPSRYTFPPFSKERRGERAESRRIHHEEGSQRRGTTRTRLDRTRRLSYPPCSHGCHRRVPTAPLVCYCVAQAVAAAGCRCTLHYLRSERRGDERFGGVHCDRVI